MKIEALEITGIRLIGFYFLFSTTHHIAGALNALYHEASEPGAEALIAAFANAASLTQSILAFLVLGLAIVAMLRPHAIQKRWRKIDSENHEKAHFDPESLTLFRMAALMMALFFAQKTLSDFIEIAMISNISFSGFYAAKTISDLVTMVLSLYLFRKPEVINKWK